MVILCNPPLDHPYLTTLLDEFEHNDSPHRLMIVGDLSLMLDLGSQPVWSKISLVYCLVTMHDKRSKLFEELTTRHLVQSAGIPSFVLQLLHDKKVPERDDPIYFWKLTPDLRVRVLAMQLFVFQHTLATINTNWTYGCIDVLDLARSCGCFVTEPHIASIQTPNSSFASADSTLQLQYSSKIVVWPDHLLKRFTLERANDVTDLQPKDTDVGWFLLEQITVDKMTKQYTVSQTLGQRFTFLTTSFIAHIKHEVTYMYEVIPQVSAQAQRLPQSRYLMSMERFLAKDTVNREDFWEFIKHVMLPNRPMVCRYKGSTSDYLVKLVDGDKEHLLFIQLKIGEEKLSIDHLLDEMAKSPGVEDKALAYRDILYRESAEHGFKLTFVFGAISHPLQLNKAYLAKDSNSRFGALRITHESYKKVPENVEVIILLEAGLVNLLGVDNYDFIKEYHANKVRQIRALERLAVDVQKTLVSILERKARLTKIDIKLNLTVTPKKSASPEHASMVVEAPYSPTPSRANEITEPLAVTSAQANQQKRNVRQREDNEESGAEPVQKKQKTEDSVGANEQEKKIE